MEMACQAVYRWTFVGLVGAFLDLAIAYCFLCASAIAYMTSKFLGFFGLRLPCPCSAIYGFDSNRILCLQKLLTEYPTEKISNVQLSVISKFPFTDSAWEKDQSCDMNFRLIENKERDVIEMEGEGDASCSSLLSDSRKSNSIVSVKGDMNAIKEVGVATVSVGREGRFDLKGKGVRHRSGIRRRKKGAFDLGKYSSVASFDPSVREAQGGAHNSPTSINKGQNKSVEDNIVLQHYGGDKHQFNYTDETPPIMKWGKRSSNRFELREVSDFSDEQVKELKETEQVNELKENGQSGLDLSSEYKNTIRLLEQALQDEHAASAALYHELEKERSAAASAADEAMAMILRIQEEKASIEMEARQYQRIIEEKSAYDAEEMNILKEIIVRRETEKHFLEKEVEEYRQFRNLGNDHPSDGGVDMLDQQQPRFDYSFDPNDDPVLMLHHLSSAIDKKMMVETKRPDEVMSSGRGRGELAPQKELLSQNLDDVSAVEGQGHPLDSNDESSDFQDKVISMDSNSYVSAGYSQSSESFYQSYTAGNSEQNFQEEITIPLDRGIEYRENMNMPSVIARSNVETSPIPYGNVFPNQHESDSDLETQSSCNLFGKESHVHDLHVIDQANFSVGETSGILRSNSIPSEAPVVKRTSSTSSCRITSSSKAEDDFKRANLDTSSRLPPLCPKGKSLVSDLWQNSLSGGDDERMRIGHEVGWLQERLKIVQEGREKLNMSMVSLERGNSQLKLLENIENQLKELRKLTQPKKPARQSSLPPPSAKAISKKRRSRSVSSSLQNSS